MQYKSLLAKRGSLSRFRQELNTFDSLFTDSAQMGKGLFGSRNQLGFTFFQSTLVIKFFEETIRKIWFGLHSASSRSWRRQPIIFLKKKICMIRKPLGVIMRGHFSNWTHYLVRWAELMRSSSFFKSFVF